MTANTSDCVKPASREVLLSHAARLGLELDDDVPDAVLIEEVERRRLLIDSLPVETLRQIAAWAGRSAESADKLELVRSIAGLRHMRFAGLSDGALRALAMLRGCDVEPDDGRDELKRKIKKREGLWAKLGRKKRALIGKLIAKIAGEAEAGKTLPEDCRPLSLKEHIENEGVGGGLGKRIRGAADDYLRDKLDEIEARIDRKLDEIDRRLAQWRDREIANRLRIIRITLMASIIVALLSLAYTWVKGHVGW